MIDLHCHVLPALDDGPADMGGTLALAREAVAGGTHTIVATPHVNWTYPHVDAAAVAGRVAEVNDALRAERIDLEVRPGAEIALTRGIELPDAQLAALRLGGGPWLLLECPLEQGAGTMFEGAAMQLAARGHRVLLAHPERSPAFMRNAEALERLVAAGMLAQVTAGALNGRFGRTVRDVAWGLVARGLVHNVATDAHAAGGARGAGLAGELRAAGFDDAWADHVGRAVPLALLDGTRLPPPPGPPPEAPRRAGLLGRLGVRRA